MKSIVLIALSVMFFIGCSSEPQPVKKDIDMERVDKAYQELERSN